MMEASPNMAAAADGDTIPQGESYPGSLALSPQFRDAERNGKLYFAMRARFMRRFALFVRLNFSILMSTYDAHQLCLRSCRLTYIDS